MQKKDDAEKQGILQEGSSRNFAKLRRLTVAVRASILATWFVTRLRLPWLVVAGRRRVGRELVIFFPAHPKKRVGFVFGRFLRKRERRGRESDFENVEIYSYIID